MRAKVEVRQFIERKPRPKNAYGVRFMMLSQDAVGELSERLADHSIGMQAMRVLLVMIGSLDYENRVEAPQKEIACRLGMSQGEVSKASAALVECGFIERMANRRGWYRVSPRLCWRGSVKNLDAALREREAA
jgi:transcription initiation factor IIE alpha subunit